MKAIACLLALALFLCAGPAVAADRISKAEFEAVIAEKCTVCHERARIAEALQRGDKIEAILEKMLRFGVNLSERDRNVIGTFWGDPLK